MKSPTSHFKKMKKNLAHARKIVSRVDPAECKTPLQHLKLKSYILLCHAIIEEYIEDLGYDVAMQARQMFKNKGLICKTLVSLVASGVMDEIKNNKSKHKIGKDLVKNLEIFSTESFNKYKNIVDNNHGIKLENLSSVFVPIGFDPEAIDLALVNQLSAFGEKRGGVAHKFAIREEATLSAVDSDMNVIVRDLQQFDQEACSCLNSKMSA
jgi:hypothetical protein